MQNFRIKSIVIKGRHPKKNCRKSENGIIEGGGSEKLLNFHHLQMMKINNINIINNINNININNNNNSTPNNENKRRATIKIIIANGL